MKELLYYVVWNTDKTYGYITTDKYSAENAAKRWDYITINSNGSGIFETLVIEDDISN